MAWVNIVTGQPYPGKVPDEVSVTRLQRIDENLTAFAAKPIREGDPGYDDALSSWMYRRGYVREGDLTERDADGAGHPVPGAE